MLTAYHVFTALLSPAVFVLFSLYAILTGNKRRGLFEHFGAVPGRRSTPGSSPRKLVWLHALSRGEVMAAVPVLKALRAKNPELRFAVSVTTESGYGAASGLRELADYIFFHPLDCLPFYALAVNRLRPDIFILTETGLWPGLPDFLRRRGIPVMLFHGRISAASLPRYQLFSGLLGNILNRFSRICVQSGRGRDDFLSLGVEPARVIVTGDSKYDALRAVTADERANLRARLGLPPARPVITAGSTHAGEEEMILDALAHLSANKHPDFLLVLAPRRIERAGELADLLLKRGFSCKRRSETDGPIGDVRVLLLDTFGELVEFYSIAQVAFVGNSLVRPGGGHSLIEPASLGIRVLHGPFLDYKQEDADFLAGCGLSVCIHTAEEMAAQLDSVLSDPALRSNLQERAQRALADRRGASGRLAELVLALLAGHSS